MAHGLKFKVVNQATGDPVTPYEKGEHINILEFVGIIINTWFALKFIRRLGPIDGGHILQMLADNTFALSWMTHFSRTHRREVSQLSLFYNALLLQGQSPPCKIMGQHLPGDLNGPADALSRPTYDARGDICSLTSVIKTWPSLRVCTPYQVPSELLSTIVWAMSEQATVATFVEVTTKLMTLEPNIASVGS